MILRKQSGLTTANENNLKIRIMLELIKNKRELYAEKRQLQQMKQEFESTGNLDVLSRVHLAENLVQKGTHYQVETTTGIVRTNSPLEAAQLFLDPETDLIRIATDEASFERNEWNTVVETTIRQRKLRKVK